VKAKPKKCSISPDDFVRIAPPYQVRRHIVELIRANIMAAGIRSLSTINVELGIRATSDEYEAAKSRRVTFRGVTLDPLGRNDAEGQV
jgi:hypothetical protein